MNRFRTRRRAKDDASASRPSMDSDSAGPFKLFGGKKKLPDTESKLNLDLDAALPSSDDFRTSLLMTGLSARFSMLREQDDPRSKLGKASDDSVLFPKRQSRLMDYGYLAGLHDIAESDSMQLSTLTRINSLQGSEDNDAGNIMDRARPNDGNNLFGGRQKIYRLAAGAKSNASGMAGRYLYEDDVAKSAFQKWRQAEKERSSFEENGASDSEYAFDYNKTRATNSTTSSGLSAGRNSSAATSITSQALPAKDGQFTIPPSANNVERSFARTRRLYEQGLTQDLQDQQSSALSRMDTISKSHRGKVVPDSPVVPSPTTCIYGDRVMERRTIFTKASAPNLRTHTPPASVASQLSTDSAPKCAPELKSTFGVSPPLSPPISETDDVPKLAIQPSDRGKATALGVFNRPVQKYDDSKFAQRQQQLRKGRDLFDNQSQNGPASNDISTSRSSSTHRSIHQGNDRLVKKDCQSNSFFDDNSDDGSGPTSFLNLVSPVDTQLSPEKPSDQGHPAFRQLALPTPLSLSSRDSYGSSSADGVASTNIHMEAATSDSPTLGPGSGLSGLVRQHLRSDSNASSVYDTADFEIPLQSLSPTSKKIGGNHDGFDKSALPNDEPGTSSGHSPTAPKTLSPAGLEHDDFARHLADGARRVREKLISYAEPEQVQAPPPLPPPESTKDLAGARSNALGILRNKSSRTSLFDRARAREGDSDFNSKRGKSPAPSGRKPLVEAASQEVPVPLSKSENMPAGLKAFRQARRELQKMKEHEIQQRHGSPPQNAGNRAERPALQRLVVPRSSDSSSPSHQPVGFCSNGYGPSERDRSGSDSSREGPERQRRMAGRGVSKSKESSAIAGSQTGNQSVPMSKRRDFSEAAYLQRRQEPADPRTHGLNLDRALASGPKMQAPNGVPPLPPINPRRKNGQVVQGHHSGEQADSVSPDDGPYEGGGAEQPRRMYRATNEQNGDGLRRYPPPPTYRPPLPHASMTRKKFTGGLI